MTDVAELIDNTFLRQFELKVDEDLAKIEYSLQERKIFLTKIEVPESVDNPEFIENFIKSVMDNIKERNISVVPTSPPIAKFMRRNRRYKSMLPVGVRI